MEITRALADYVVQSRIDQIPEAVRHEATRSFLNWLGCAIGGCRHEAVERALAARSPFSGPQQVALIGRGTRTDLLTATLINGISAHVLDFDDSQLRATNINPSSSVAPPALCLGEYLRVTGAEVLHAFILGLEVECRIANAVYATGSRHWFANSTAGVFGAAAAAGKLLGLDCKRMTRALGIAAAQASGLREVFGFMAKSFIVGRAAQNGLEAAFLARNGFTSSEHSIEAPLGFAQIFSPGSDPAPIVKDLGRTYEVSYNTYKPFACGIVLHAAIDACIRVRKENNFNTAEVDKVALRVNPAVVEVTGKPAPGSGLESKFSVVHSAAVALIDGTAGEKQYTDQRAADPTVIALRGRVQATPDAALRRDQAHVRILLKDGRVFEKMIEHAIGSLQNPLSDKDLEAKLRGQAEDILTSDVIDNLIKLCWSVTTLDDISVIAKTAEPKSGS